MNLHENNHQLRARLFPGGGLQPRYDILTWFQTMLSLKHSHWCEQFGEVYKACGKMWKAEWLDSEMLHEVKWSRFDMCLNPDIQIKPCQFQGADLSGTRLQIQTDRCKCFSAIQSSYWSCWNLIRARINDNNYNNLSSGKSLLIFKTFLGSSRANMLFRQIIRENETPLLLYIVV